jgi:hypothetical protein
LVFGGLSSVESSKAKTPRLKRILLPYKVFVSVTTVPSVLALEVFISVVGLPTNWNMTIFLALVVTKTV